jgi:hypothetical protein
VEGLNTTNGVTTTYFITWFTEVDTEDEDYMEIHLAPEMQMVTKNNANRELICRGVNGITDIFCEQDANDELLLKLKLNTVSQATGLYKIQLTNEQEDDEDWKDGDPIGGLRNALSLRGSSNFGTII